MSDINLMNQSVIASLNLENAAKAIPLYQKALGAQLIYQLNYPDDEGKVMHASLTIGNSQIFIGDVNPAMGCAKPSESAFYVYLDDVDNAYKRAQNAGFEAISPVQDMFWGDRTGTLKDSFGIMWTLATHVKDVTPEEMKEGMKQFGKKA